MEVARIVFQSLTIISIILAIFQKEKWKIMLFHAITNALYVAMFLVFGRTTTALICAIAVLKNLVYMLFAYKKVKPNWIVLTIFTAAYIGITIITWQDLYDILPLIAMLSSNYGAWQDNIFILRIGYMINGVSYITYKLLIGAYISMALEVVTLTCQIVCFVYYCILKKEKPIMEVLFGKGKKSPATIIDNKLDAMMEDIPMNTLEETADKKESTEDAENNATENDAAENDKKETDKKETDNQT